jgi:hypothetical protein
MTEGELFDELDLDGDGNLWREELNQAACRLGWHWHEAPLYALLDFLTIRTPLARDAFISCMDQVSKDPDGVYGQVLKQALFDSEQSHSNGLLDMNKTNPGVGCGSGYPASSGTACNATEFESIVGLLKDIGNDQVAAEYAVALDRLNVSPVRVRSDEAALLIIDPQRSFTSGAWMWSMGPVGNFEVMPIRLAFENCACLLKSVYQRSEVMFTRCPFPPESYGWDERLDGIIDPGQLYFIKPGNNVLVPRTNGYREWVESLIQGGKKTLVMGGCTLNSCVRVSAIESLKCFRNKDLEVFVDLSLCGARTDNYAKSPLFEGMSSVESAIQEMSAAGVVIAERVEWL